MNSPIFIVGCPRSGTTLLSVMLDRHNELAITPETAFYDDIAPQLANRQDLGTVLAEWRRLPELGVSINAVVKRCTSSREPRRVLNVVLGLYAEARSKPYCGEKTPQHLFHVPRIIEDFPEAKILCLIRDGRDVALSLSSMPWWEPEGLRFAADYWLQSIAFSERFLRIYQDQFMIIRYESLVTEPEAIMLQVMRFLGLQFQPRQIKPGPSDVVLTRSIAWKGMALGPINRSRVGRWRSEVSSEDLAFLHEALDATLTRLGYPV